jgi:hypothetical protein
MLKMLQISVLALGVAFFLALAGLAYYSSSAPQPSEQQSNTQTNEKKQGENQHTLRGFVSFLFPDAISIFTFWLVVATIVLGVIAYVQIEFLRKAEAISSQAANAAKQAADAARDSVNLAGDTAEKQLRAYLFVQGSEAPDIDEWDGKGLGVILKNYGQTPAYDVHFWHGLALKELPLTSALPVPPPKIDNPTKTVLNPGQEMTLPLRAPRQLTPAERQAVLAQTSTIYVFGEIYYRDIFKKDHVAKFRMHYEIVPAGPGTFRGMRPDTEGNEAD